MHEQHEPPRAENSPRPHGFPLRVGEDGMVEAFIDPDFAEQDPAKRSPDDEDQRPAEGHSFVVSKDGMAIAGIDSYMARQGQTRQPSDTETKRPTSRHPFVVNKNGMVVLGTDPDLMPLEAGVDPDLPEEDPGGSISDIKKQLPPQNGSPSHE